LPAEKLSPLPRLPADARLLSGPRGSVESPSVALTAVARGDAVGHAAIRGGVRRGAEKADVNTAPELAPRIG
jgi:hypothetical protein